MHAYGNIINNIQYILPGLTTEYQQCPKPNIAWVRIGRKLSHSHIAVLFSGLRSLNQKGWLHGEFQPGLEKKRDYMGNFSPGWNWMWGREPLFFIFIVVHKVLRMRLWIFSPGWNFLSITWEISARSTGLKISSRVAQTRLKFQPGLKFSSCNRKLRFTRISARSTVLKVHPGLKIPM